LLTMLLATSTGSNGALPATPSTPPASWSSPARPQGRTSRCTWAPRVYAVAAPRPATFIHRISTIPLDTASSRLPRAPWPAGCSTAVAIDDTAGSATAVAARIAAPAVAFPRARTAIARGHHGTADENGTARGNMSRGCRLTADAANAAACCPPVFVDRLPHHLQPVVAGTVTQAVGCAPLGAVRVALTQLHPARTWPRRRAPQNPRWGATGVRRDRRRLHLMSSRRGRPPFRRRIRAARRQWREGCAAASTASLLRRASSGSLTLTPGAAATAADKRTLLRCGDGGDGSGADES